MLTFHAPCPRLLRLPNVAGRKDSLVFPETPMATDRNVKQALDLRLARGEISLAEYRQILAEIDADASVQPTDTTPSLGSLVHQVDDLLIYERGLIVAGRKKAFDDIAKVEGGTWEFSINVVARARRSHISIAFRNGDSYFIDEERAYLGNKRHEAISRAAALLKRQTFLSRVRNFVRELSSAGELVIGNEATNPFPHLLFDGARIVANVVTGAPPLGPVRLSTDGVLRGPMAALNIRYCREHGLLELGVSRHNFSSPREVYATEEKPIVFATWNRSRALYFEINHEVGADAVMSVLDWFAKGGNDKTGA